MKRVTKSSKRSKKTALVTAPVIERQIRLIRGQKVMMDSDLAALYEVPTRTFNQAVRRNSARFPEDFMFQLTKTEVEALRSQSVILKPERGKHSKYLPLAFTEHGVAMLASVLRSARAVQTSILVVRAFVRMREWIASNKDLAARVEALERKQEHAGSMIEMLADDIRSLASGLHEMKALPPKPRRKIGFAVAAEAGR